MSTANMGHRPGRHWSCLSVSLTRPGSPLKLGRATPKPHLGLGEGWSRRRVKSRGFYGTGTRKGVPPAEGCPTLGCRIILVFAPRGMCSRPPQLWVTQSSLGKSYEVNINQA